MKAFLKKMKYFNIALFFGVLTLVLFILINGKPLGLAQLKENTGTSAILDVKMGYTHEEAYAIFDQLGSEGRAFYLQKIIPLDMLFPLSYVLFLLTMMIVVFKNQTSSSRFLQNAIYYPIVTGALDYIENCIIFSLLIQYPKKMPALASFAGVFTIMKWLFFALTLGVLFAGIVRLGYDAIKKKKQ